MKVIRKLLLMVLFVVGTFGIISCANDESASNESSSERISLNVTNANLIASITDNEKYLNKDYLYELKSLDDNDLINVIITLDHKGLADDFSKDDAGFKTLSDYANSPKVSPVVDSMKTRQNAFAKELLEQDLITKVNHSYTTLFNGISVTTTYGKFKKLSNSGYDCDFTISEVYSEPEYKIASVTDGQTVTNEVNVYETGIFDSSSVDYDGTNTSVAILDSGFDIHHTVFKQMPDLESIMLSKADIDDFLKDSKAFGYHQNIKVQDVYVNEKIPFAYDYADKDTDVAPYDSNHGTHVAGIIGGKDEVITGVAINTQLVLMKVFGDINNGAIQDDILAALEDAISLGVDAINLSLGSACGFSRSSDNEDINRVYDKIESNGISLVVAASNDYSSGYGGENSNTNKASNPDSATVGSPGTYSSTIAVASISGVKSKYMIDDKGHTFFFNNANNSAGEAYDFYEMLYDKLQIKGNKVEVEYVTVPGVGKKINYSNIDVEGKIALVKRGETSFEEKAQVALSEGAIGCIIYNNIAGEVYMNAGSKLEIALCSVSKDDGEYLASFGEGKLLLNTNYLAGPFMSDFSSWGPVSDLSLKPEITAHGGSILSAVPGGGYEEISGTSMACPNLCGVIILVKQLLKEKYKDNNLSSVELTNLTNSLLMSTSTIILDEQGNPYSPRKQGSGLGNLEYAVKTDAYLSVDGQTKPKLELKDDPSQVGVYTLNFNVHNLSDQELQYNLTNFTMTETLSSADPEYVAEKSYMLNPTTNAIVTGAATLDGDVITIKPNGTAKVSYTITINDEEKEYMQRSFVNGIYVEGFAVLESLNENGIDLSIPFLAFFGDWTKAPMFDKTFYEVEGEKNDASILDEDKMKADYYATTPLGTYYYSYIIPLGSYVYEIDESKYDPIPAQEEHASIGYNLETINGITTVYAGLLRNAKKMTTTIINTETGEVVYDHVKYDEHKAYFSGSIVPGYDLINITAAELGLQNNTKYTFKMEAELDYGDGGKAENLNNTFEFSFYVDYQAPIITDAEFYTKYDKSKKENRYYVDVYVYDNHYAQSVRPFTIVEGKLVSLSEYVTPVYGEKGQISKVTIEITDYMDLLQYGSNDEGEYKVTNGLGFLVDDYALNQSYSYVALPGTNTDKIEYIDGVFSSVSNGTYQYHKDLYVGDELDLTKLLKSNDESISSDPDVQASYFAKLDWTTSDENVIKVKNGQIEAVSKGTALITCTTMAANGYIYSINLRIRVRDDVPEKETQKLTKLEFTYFDTLKAFTDGPEFSEIGETGDRYFFTEKPTISFYPSEKVKLGFELEPWNLKDYELIWSSSNEKVATVDDEGVVTAYKEGSSNITLRVKINGKTSSLVASTRVNVKSEFVIEGNVLTAYKGLGGDVVIPEDKGILYIGSFAFSLYTTDYEIKIEEDDYDAAKTPASNDSVTSVVIPGDVLEVRKYAFYNCTALEKVSFNKNHEGKSCPYIREYAFAKCTKLTSIDTSAIDLIGERAFDECTSLKEIDLSNVYAIGRQAFRKCTALESVDIINLRNAGEEIFLNCTALKTIKNGEFTNFSKGMFKNSGLTSLTFYADRIPDECFENASSLKDVKIENTIVYVGKKAFANCPNLLSVSFASGAEAEFLYEEAFLNCTSLESVKLPDSSFELEKNIFNNCQNLTEVIFNTNSYISKNDGYIFSGCEKLSHFTVLDTNTFYKSKDNLLLTTDETIIVLAAINYNYGDYIIPDNIIRINEGAFSSITKLSNLRFNEKLEYIGKHAFENCQNLNTVVIKENLFIDDYVFNNCTALSYLLNPTLIKEFNNYAFANTAIKDLKLNDVVIHEGAFNNCDQLINVALNVTTVGKYAFAECDSLKNVSLVAETIEEGAFANCKKLANLELQDTLEIGDSAFRGCTSLSKLVANEAITIGKYAFSDCKGLESISLDSVVEIKDYAFACEKDTNNQLTSIILPTTLKSIGEYAFFKNNKLISVDINADEFIVVGKGAFKECTSLVTFTLKGTLETISEEMFAEDEKLAVVDIKGIKYVLGGAFLNCYKLSIINLNDTLEIGMQAFNNCTTLVSLSLPNVIKLDDGAFLKAEALENIEMPKVEYIGHQALSCTNVSSIKLPSTLTYIASTAFYYNANQTSFTNMLGEQTCKVNDYILLDQGVLYTTTANNKYLLTSYPTGKTTKTYEVLFGTVRVDYYAASGNKYLEQVTLPDTLTLIGNMAFYDCSMLHTVEFRSEYAPVLEGTIESLGIEYEQGSEIYELLNQYFQFNGYYPLHYGQFKSMVGMGDRKLNIVLAANANQASYEDILYKLFFNLEEKTISSYQALNAKSIDYLNKVVKIPTNVTFSDEDIIIETRTAYNKLDQDLSNYGYSQSELDRLYNNLVQAENTWKNLNQTRINQTYKHLINDINSLGSTYDFDKISLYYSIVNTLKITNRDDKRFIDTTNVDNFKDEFDEYFSNLNEDIQTMTEVTTLPTYKVNKVGLVVAVTTGLSAGLFIMLILKKRWLR